MSIRVRFLAILCILGFVFVSAVYCADDVKADAKKEKKAFTQGQLAVAIVRSLGLEEEIGFDQSPVAYAAFLAGRGISPIDGWNVNFEVTKEHLAVVVVQTLGLMPEVQDRTNVADYIRVLDDRDISIEDVRKVLSNIFVLNVLVDVIGGAPGGDTPLTGTTGF